MAQRKKRFNLSEIKGMNVSEFQHASNEATKLVNLKPSENGLEERLGARRINTSTWTTKKILNSDATITDAGDLYSFDSNPAAGHKVFTSQGYQPFGVCSDVFKTDYKNVFVVKKDSECYIGTINRSLFILLKHVTITNEEQDLVLYEYNPDLRSLISGGLADRSGNYPGSGSTNSTNYTTYPIDAYVTRLPVCINDKFKNPWSGQTTNYLYIHEAASMYSYDITKGKKNNCDYPFSAATNPCSGSREPRGTNLWNIDVNTLAGNTGDTILKCIDTGETNPHTTWCIFSSGATTYLKGYGFPFSLLYPIPLGVIATDICYVYYTSGSAVGVGLKCVIAFTTSSDTNLRIIRINQDSSGGPTTIAISVVSGVTIPTGGKIIFNDFLVDRAIKVERQSLFAVYSATKIEIYSCTIFYDPASPNTPAVYSAQIVDTITINNFPVNSAQIISCAFYGNPANLKGGSLYPINKHSFVGIRPWFGTGSATDVLAANDTTDYKMFGIPQLENFDVPIDPDNCSILNVMQNTSTKTRRLSWLFHIFPAPTLDLSAKDIMPALGYTDTNGKFIVNAHTKTSDANAIPVNTTVSSTVWTADNVLLHDIISGSAVPSIRRFTSPIAYNIRSSRKILPQDYKFGILSAFADYENSLVYFTKQGLFYINLANHQPMSSRPIQLAWNDTGLFVLCESVLNLVHVVNATVSSMQKILSMGAEKADSRGLCAWGQYAALHNDVSCFLITGTTVLDIGKKIEPYITKLTGGRFSAFDEVNGALVIPVNIQATGNIDSGAITYKVGLALWDLRTNSWILYGYHDAVGNAGNNYVEFNDLTKSIVANIGGYVCEIETSPDWFRDNMLYLNESWDGMIVEFATREMSFEDVGSMKKIRRADISNIRLRDTLYPMDSVAINIIQDYKNNSGLGNVADSVTLTGQINQSFELPLDANIYSCVIDVKMSRTTDNNNSRFVLKDLILTIIETLRPRRGGYD